MVSPIRPSLLDSQQPSPYSLIDRVVRQGDPDAWNRLAAILGPFLHHYALRHLRLQPSDLDELVQNVLVTLHRGLRTYARESGPFRVWLRRVALNKHREMQRGRKLELLPPDDARLNHPLPTHAEDPFEESEFRKYLVDRVLQVIGAEARRAGGRVMKRRWIIFRAFYRHGVPVEKIAGKLGMSRGAVHTSLCRVRKEIRAQLEGLIDPEG